MKEKKTDKIKSYKIETLTISLLIVGILLVIIFGLSKFVTFRIDLTEGKKFSLSKPTLDIIKNLKNRLIIKYYYNDSFRRHVSMSKIAQYVSDILREYRDHSKGMIEIIIEELSIDKDREKLDELESKGFNYRALAEATQSGEAKFAQGLSGIILNYENKESVIPDIFSDIGFEYVLDKEIKKLTSEKEQNIGLILAYGNKSFENEYKYLKQLIETEYKVTIINSGENIPNFVDLILIIGAEQLTDYDLFNIDQFIMNKGKALILSSGINVIYNRYSQIAIPKDSKLFDLLKHYGITINRNLVGDNESYKPLPKSIFEQLRYPVWPLITGENINRNHPIVKNLRKITLFWPSSIDISDTIKDKTEILLKTTKKAWAKTERMELNPTIYRYPLEEGNNQYNLACAFSGELTSFYKDKPIPKNEVNPNIKYEKEKKESGKAKLVIIANDMFLESLILEAGLATQEELILLINSIDWLLEDFSLIQIRDKGSFSRPLDKVASGNIREFNKRKNIIIAVSTYIVPIIIILIAVMLNISRWQKRKKLKDEYKK